VAKIGDSVFGNLDEEKVRELVRRCLEPAGERAGASVASSMRVTPQAGNMKEVSQ